MRTYLDCIPCFFRQLLSAARIANISARDQKKILDKFAQILPDISLSSSPPEIAHIAYGILTKISGKKDPYNRIRRKSNEIALSFLPQLKKKIEGTKDKLLKCVELAILGNVIDFGVRDDLNLRSEIKKILNTDNYKKSIFHYSEFKRVLKKSDFILYLADNAGETVFDRILLEEMKNTYPQKKIYYVVKSEPIINDALLDDAYRVGINMFAYVMTNGSKAPGTIISLCSKEFKGIYKKADMIISKGQGNFESLSRSTKDIFFMFMVKCSVVAKHIGCNISDLVLLYNKKRR